MPRESFLEVENANRVPLSELELGMSITKKFPCRAAAEKSAKVLYT